MTFTSTRYARGLGATMLPPTAMLTPEAAATFRDSGGGVQQFSARERERMAAELRSAAEPVLAQARTRSEMFGWDRRWASDARWTDARFCIGPMAPYESRAQCGGDPICNWGFYNVLTDCSADTFLDILFQGGRYEWAQAQLRVLLANKPGSGGRGGDGSRSTHYATQWADWTLEVFRLVSLARWSSNISSDYAPLGPRTQAKMAELVAMIPAPSKQRGGDIYPIRDRHTLSLFMPRNFNNIRRGPIPIPQHSAAFDPVRQFTHGSSFAVTPPTVEGVIGTWPWSVVPRSPGSDLRAQMIAWYERTLGSEMWFSGTSLADYITREGCMDPGGCRAQSGVPFHWGSGNNTILLAEAMALDTLETSFGQLVASGIERFLALYDSIPPQFQILGRDEIATVRDALIEMQNNETMGALGAAFGGIAAVLNVVPVFGQIASAIVIVIAAVLALLIVILQAAGAMAFGGGVLEAACLASPVIRMIPTPEVDGVLACDFDVRASRGVSHVREAVQRLRAVRAAAAQELPVADWFEASKHANDGTVVEAFIPPDRLPPPGGEPKIPWLGLGVAGAVLLGGVVLLQR